MTATDTYATACPPSTGEGSFLVELFAALAASNVEYCVLRNHETLPCAVAGRDIDVLTSGACLEEVAELIEAAARRTAVVAVWQRVEDARTVVHCLGSYALGELWCVRIDLHTALRWKGFDYYASGQVLSRATKHSWIAAAETVDSALIAFLKDVLFTGSSRDRYLIEAVSVFRHYPGTVRRRLNGMYGREAAAIVETLRTGTIEPSLATRLRRALAIRQLFQSPARVVGTQLERLSQRCGRLLRRRGLFVAVVGSDGAGKSTLIEDVRRKLQRVLHNGVHVQHWRPSILPRPFRRLKERVAKPNAPHLSPPSGLFGSLFRLAYYAVDFALGYWIRLYPALLRPATVYMSDRYYYDYYVDQERYRMRIPNAWVRLFEVIVPRPDLVILPQPRPEVFHHRKPELTLQELRMQATRICEFARRLDNAVWIDTCGGVERSSEQMLTAILARMGTR